jgi:hypothetical protein
MSASDSKKTPKTPKICSVCKTELPKGWKMDRIGATMKWAYYHPGECWAKHLAAELKKKNDKMDSDDSEDDVPITYRFNKRTEDGKFEDASDDDILLPGEVYVDPRTHVCHVDSTCDWLSKFHGPTKKEPKGAVWCVTCCKDKAGVSARRRCMLCCIAPTVINDVCSGCYNKCRKCNEMSASTSQLCGACWFDDLERSDWIKMRANPKAPLKPFVLVVPFTDGHGFTATCWAKTKTRAAWTFINHYANAGDPYASKSTREIYDKIMDKSRILRHIREIINYGRDAKKAGMSELEVMVHKDFAVDPMTLSSD